MEHTMKKIITFLFGVFVLLPAVAEDLSYIEEWNSVDGQHSDLEGESKDWWISTLKKSKYGDEDFKPWFFAKEMIKICHQAREGMMAVYFSPTQYSQSMDSYNRQLEKYATSFQAQRFFIGAMELIILDSRAYSFQKSIINGMSFSAGNEECNKWRAALQMSEYGM